MSDHPIPRRTLKRKEREGSLPPAKLSAAKVVEPVSSNRLLAGYMAYEFLSKGTLFGEKFDPARVEAAPLALAKSSAESKKMRPEGEPSRTKEHGNYAEVATILKTDGAHIPGVVNPTQLARWIQM